MASAAVGNKLSDDHALGYIELTLRVVNEGDFVEGDFVENVDAVPLLSANDFAGSVWNLDVGRGVHLSVFY